MVEYTFPQDWGTGSYPEKAGDANDAANFGSLIGAAQPISVVLFGLTFKNVDFTNLTFDVDAGKVYFVDNGITAATSSEELDGVGFVNQLDPRTGLTLAENTVNHVYVATDLSDRDKLYVDVNSTETPPSDPSLKVGEIDTSSDETSEQWHLVADDGTLTFPDEAAADTAASNLKAGTVIYDRSGEEHHYVN